jgi:hypothetical protein
LLFFSLVLAASLRQVDIALRAAFTASCASFESPGTDTGLKPQGVNSARLLCIVVSPLGLGPPFTREIAAQHKKDVKHTYWIALI